MLWRQADYYGDFRCKGGDCRNSCCEGWEIAVGMEDYFRLIALECGDELHHKIECAFRTPQSPSPERYRLISPNWLGMCPLHDEGGLCMLHRDCGAGALPEICRVYPRSLKRLCGQGRACCSNSCEAVIEALMRDAPLSFPSAPLDARPELDEGGDPAALTLGWACISLIQDRSLALDARVGKVCSLLNRGARARRNPGAEDGLRALMSALEALRPEFRSLDAFGAAAFERYTGTGSLERHRADMAALRARFPKLDLWMENVLANHFFYAGFPAVDARLEPADACPGLCLLYSGALAAAAAHCALHPGRDALADALAGFFRMAEHSAFYYNARVLLREPAALLAI